MLLCKANNSKMEEVRKFIPVSSSSDFDSLSPHIANAERDYLIPVIGQAMYDQLHTYYNSMISDPYSVEGDCKEQKLLSLVRSAVLHLSYWIGYDLLNVEVTDSGFRRTESTSVKGLWKYQDENLRGYFRIYGFNGIDTVLQYLEDNISDFPAFEGSPEYTILKSSFIPSTLIFDRIVYIRRSRLTFLRMKPHMNLVEDTEISTILGPVAFDYVKTQMLLDQPAETVVKLLEYIRKPIAYLSSAFLMEESGADLNDNGLYYTSTIAISSNDTERKPASGDRIQIMVNRNRNLGNAYLDQLRSYLVAHAADWQDVAPSTGKILSRNNKDKKTFWV